MLWDKTPEITTIIIIPITMYLLPDCDARAYTVATLNAQINLYVNDIKIFMCHSRYAQHSSACVGAREKYVQV